MTDEWELDCYSRPVIGEDGKKLWELLLTDSESRFRYLKPIPSNLVNSRNVRKIVEDILEQSPVRPKSIRFFRNQMFNMINIALSTLDVDVKPSRRTTSLYMWLQVGSFIFIFLYCMSNNTIYVIENVTDRIFFVVI